MKRFSAIKPSQTQPANERNEMAKMVDVNIDGKVIRLYEDFLLEVTKTAIRVIEEVCEELLKNPLELSTSFWSMNFSLSVNDEGVENLGRILEASALNYLKSKKAYCYELLISLERRFNIQTIKTSTEYQMRFTFITPEEYKERRNGREIYINLTCGCCGVSGSQKYLAKCSGCGFVYYCSKKCQLKHRKEHKISCNAIAAVRNELPPSYPGPPPYQPREPPPPAYIKKEKKTMSPFHQYDRARAGAYPPHSENSSAPLRTNFISVC